MIRSQSPATAIFPDLTLPVVEEPERETLLKECATKKAATRLGKTNANNLYFCIENTCMTVINFL